MFRKKQSVAAAAAQLRGGTQSPFGAGLPAVPPGEAQLYRAMRQSLPVLDAAIGKLVRLSGGFTVRSAQRETALNEFLRTVPCGRIRPSSSQPHSTTSRGDFPSRSSSAFTSPQHTARRSPCATSISPTARP